MQPLLMHVNIVRASRKTDAGRVCFKGELPVSSVTEQAQLNCNPIIPEKDDDPLMRTRRLSRAATEIYDCKLQPFGVGAVQFALLEVIDQLAPATRAAIARNQGLDKSTLTRDLKSILSKGWVQEVRQGANGRSKPVALTKAGKQLLLDAKFACRTAQDEVKALLREQGFSPQSSVAVFRSLE